MADETAALDDDRVDRTDALGARGETIEQRKHGFLVRKSHVDAGKAECAHAAEHGAQHRAVGTGDFDQMVVAAPAEGGGGGLVHGR